MALATAAAVVAAVAVSVVAVFFALYAVVEPHVGAAGGAATVAFAAALLAALIAVIAARKMEGERRQQASAASAQPDPGMAGVILNLVKDRPLLSAGAAIAVGVYALKNPALISAVVRAFVDQPGPRGRS